MLTNANHQAPDQPTGNSSGPDAASNAATPPAILERHHRSIQRLGMAAYRNRSPQRGHQQSTRLGQQNGGPLMVLYEPHRGPQPRPAQTLFDSRCAGHDRAHHRWRHQATGSPDTGLSRQHTEDGYQHLAHRQPLDLQPHRRDPAVRHSSRMETHRQHGDAGSQSPTSRMGFRPLPSEANGSEGRLPGNEQRQDLQPGTQVPPDTGRKNRRSIRPTQLPQPPEPQAGHATYQTTP